MNPLMFEGLLPDSRQVSRDAAERHAILTSRTQREHPPRARLQAPRLVPQS
jgi:hypothetical protein